MVYKVWISPYVDLTEFAMSAIIGVVGLMARIWERLLLKLSIKENE